MDTDTLVLLLNFYIMSYYFWITTWMKFVNNFQVAKVQLQSAEDFTKFSLALLIKVSLIKKRLLYQYNILTY